MTPPRWSPSPPRYLRRWGVQGLKPDGNAATTIFDLREDRLHVAVYPATVEAFALLIDKASIRVLLTTAESGDACAVPGLHAIHGARLLGLHPYESPHAEPSWINRPADARPYHGPMELYVRLPDDQIQIIYGHGRLLALQDTLAEIVSLVR